MALALDEILSRLTAGAGRWQQADPAARAAVARTAAHAVAEQAEAWVDAAVAIKSAGNSAGSSTASNPGGTHDTPPRAPRPTRDSSPADYTQDR